MPVLPDGTVIPSGIGIEDRGSPDTTTVFGNVALRQGEIVSIVHPDDSKNFDKKAVSTRYKVAVQHQDGSGPVSTVFYPHCIAISDFGGVADRTHVTYRAREKDPDTGEVISNGSVVLVLCVNGDTNRAYIIGGLPPKSPVDSSKEGHHYYFEFNGVTATIDDAGTFQIIHKGKTKADGTVENDDDQTNGTTILMDENGDIFLQTGKNGDNVIHLDSQNKEILVDAQGNIKLTSSGVMTGDATDATMLGTTYRNAQQQLHTQLQTAFQTLNGLLTAVGTQLSAAGAAMVTPVVGPVIAAPAVVASGVSLTAAAAVCAEAMAALQAFEAQASTYLSTKNKSD